MQSSHGKSTRGLALIHCANKFRIVSGRGLPTNHRLNFQVDGKAATAWASDFRQHTFGRLLAQFKLAEWVIKNARGQKALVPRFQVERLFEQRQIAVQRDQSFAELARCDKVIDQQRSRPDPQILRTGWFKQRRKLRD